MKYPERFSEPLFNPSWEQVVAREPLIAFSHYLSGRVNVLFAFAAELLENLDAGFSDERVDGGKVERAESLMWLWTLGAYEVVRTMHQARESFGERARQELAGLKRTLATVRMPAAKMEKPGKGNRPVTSNRSPSGWDPENRDLLINDPEETPAISARWLISEFDRVICSITPADVLSHHGSKPPAGGA
jgi:hypothetical protein